MDFSFAIYILVLPLVTFLFTGLFGMQLPKRFSGVLGTTSMAVAAILAFVVAYNYFFVSGKIGDAYTTITALNYTWLQFSPSLTIKMGIILDPISVMMLVVVTFVSLMVHLY